MSASITAFPALSEPDVLLRRAAALLGAGRTAAARPLLAAIRRMVPDSAELARLAAVLAMREDRLEEAGDALEHAIAGFPRDPMLRKLRAELRLRLDDAAGAAADAAEAVVLDPADPFAKALLGGVLLECRRPADAAACLAEAVRAAPANAAFRQGLAAAQESNGDVGGAAATLAEGIALCPAVAALRTAAILLAMRQHDFAAALETAEKATRDGAVDACVFGLMGHALSSVGRHDEAAQSYREALKLAPDDPYVRHLVASAGVLPSGDRAPEPYLRAVFDGYAARFETHLIELGYRVPGLLRGALRRHLPELDAGEHGGAVLDLGCGTGLVAVACSDLPLGPWEGVDVAPRMLAQAATKQLYAALHESDLVACLAAERRSWPIILAADVFCYFGALADALALVHDRLRPGGLFLMSLEERHDSPGREVPTAGWALERQGRYSHELQYVEAAARAAGLRVRELDRQTLRQEAGAPVRGLLVVLERSC